jgi:ubiquinone/menaquinone biosynthesis C-methylase UbiE
MKRGEIDYIKNIGNEGANHALNKPYSDKKCGLYLIDIGSIIHLLPSLPAKLLDMGCGTGWTSILFAKKGYTVTGQDISDDMIELANRNKGKENLPNLGFRKGYFETINSTENYDCVVFYDSLHHAEDERAALTVAYKSLKKDGILITLEPGGGHSKANISIDVSKKYGVAEKDMPPYYIIKIGKEIGFKRFKVYSRYSNNEVTELYDSEIPEFSTFFHFVILIIRTILRDLKRAVINYRNIPGFLKTSNIVLLSK